MTTTTETTTAKKTRTSPAYTAFVTRFNAPGETTTTIETVTRKTKREIQDALADPMVENVLAIVKGKLLDVRVTKQVNF